MKQHPYNPTLYDRILGFDREDSQKIGKALNDLIKKEIKSRQISILSPGIGTGRLEKALLSCSKESGRKYNITGIDVNDKMLQYIKTRPWFRTLGKNIKLKKKDFLKYNTKKKFDVCFSFFILQHLGENWRNALLKMESLLKPSGLLFLSEEQGDMALWDKVFKWLHIEDIKYINGTENRHFFAKTAAEFWKKAETYGINRNPLFSACDMQNIVELLEMEFHFKKIAEFPISWKKNFLFSDWIKSISQGQFSFFRTKKKSNGVEEWFELLKKEDGVRKIESNNRLKMYAFRKVVKHSSKQKENWLQPHIFSKARTLCKESVYYNSNSYFWENVNRIKLLLTYGLVNDVQFLYTAAWSLQIGENGDWVRKIPAWCKGLDKSKFGEFLFSQILYFALTKADPELQDFKINEFVFRNLPDLPILSIRFDASSVFSFDIEFKERTPEIRKICIIIPEKNLFRGKINSTVISVTEDIVLEACKEGYIEDLKKINERANKVLESEIVQNAIEQTHRISEITEFAEKLWGGFKDIAGFTGNPAWEIPRNLIRKVIKTIYYTRVLKMPSGNWNEMLFYPGKSLVDESFDSSDRHVTNQRSSFGLVIIKKKSQILEENQLLTVLDLWARADAIHDWAEKSKKAQHLSDYRILKHFIPTANTALSDFVNKCSCQSRSRKSLIEHVAASLNAYAKLDEVLRKPDKEFEKYLQSIKVDDIIDRCKNIARTIGVKIKYKRKLPQQRKVVCNPVAIEWVIFQLLDNACKANAKNITLAVKDSSHHTKFEIKDNGQGMLDETMKQLEVLLKTGNRNALKHKFQIGTRTGLLAIQTILEKHKVPFDHRNIRQCKKGGTIIWFNLPKGS